MPVQRLRELYSQFTDWFRRLPPRARWVTAGTAAVCLAALLVLALRGSGGPEMEPLFTRLSPEDAAAIVGQLEEKGVAYQLADDGTAILVPADQVDRLRLEMAAQGLPREGTVGFELMDDVPFGATEFERRVRYLRALQGELARTVAGIEGVEDARVHVVLPEDSPFVGERQPATAAVFVRLRPGAQLEEDQVRAIMHLVSSAVEGLEPQDVTVVDGTGKLLSAEVGPGEEDGGTAGDRFEKEREFESELQHNLQTLLEQVLGPGNVVARVNAELNFDRQTIERRMFEPPADGGEGLLRSIQELEETFAGEGAPAGVPGDTNIPTYPQVAGGNGEYQRNERTANYELNEIIDRVQVAPGAVRRLSVAVVVNGQLTPDRQQALEQVVAAAIGSDPGRQDQVQVVGMPFNTDMADQIQRSLEEERQAREAMIRGLLVAAGALAAVALLVGAIVLWRRRRRVVEEELALEEAGEVMPPEGVAEEVPPPAPTRSNGRPTAPPIYEQVSDLVRNHPEHIAQVIRSWLSER
ncbi:MAG TPA: flagellar basal-body MS-ring/collar protein FliF [Thermaerobacter sp.]